MNAKLWLAGRALTVGGHVLTEKVTRPVARTIEDVPISGATVSEEWLTAILCLEVPGAEVTSFAIPGGSSGSSERLALRVTYNDAGREAGLPTELFTKAAASYRQRMLVGGAGVLQGEPHFYTVIRPKSSIEAPRGYWGKFDPSSWHSITVMEDVTATKGATFPVATTPLSKEQVEDLVQNLARLHGDLWEDTESIGVLKTPRDYIKNTIEFLDIRKRCGVGMER